MKASSFCCPGSRNLPGKLDAQVPQEEIVKLYDRLAGLYDVWGRLTEARARCRAIELADIKDGQSILEVAVGTGLAFSEIVRRNPHGRNLGIDLSAGMLAKADNRLRKQSAGNYSLTVGSAFDLQIESGSVDLLINNYMFDLIPYAQMDRVLDEYKRVLKNGGRLVLVNMTLGEGRGSGLYDAISRISPRTMGGCRGVRMAEKLIQHGFEVTTREYHQQLLFPSEVIVASVSSHTGLIKTGRLFSQCVREVNENFRLNCI